MKMRKLLSAVALFLCMAMTACGGTAESSTPAPAPTPSPAPEAPAPAENPPADSSADANADIPDAMPDDGVDNSWQKVLDKGEFIMGLETNFPPLGYADDSGEIMGFEVDLADEVCNRLGITLIKQPIVWAEKEDDLALGKIDCVWNGMSVTPQREKEMCLSDTYMLNHIVFVVPADSGITTIEDLAGKTVSVQDGSTSQELLEAEYADDFYTVALEDNFESLRQLGLGFFDAVCTDSSLANYWIATEAEKEYITIPATEDVDEYAIGFRKNDQSLRDKIQETMNEMVADGTFAEISIKWFGTDVNPANAGDTTPEDGDNAESAEEDAEGADADTETDAPLE